MRAPILYEVNTRAWLRDLSESAGRTVLLEDVPQAEIDRWKELGFTHIWFMGVWQVGPKAAERAVALLQSEWKDESLSESDIQGSPFAIQDYSVDRRLGEPLGLLLLKERLSAAGLKLILDFVPNHFGLDTPELYRYPDRFVQGTSLLPGTFEAETRFGKRIFAHGRDPFFPPWTDTVQLDYRQPETHEAMSLLAQTISMYGNGLRCDMAMLLLPEIFEKTWQDFPARGRAIAKRNFWRETIPKVRQLQPQVELIAEAYWDREEELQAIGFDYTYNKRVCDCLVEGRYGDLQELLSRCSIEYLNHSVHFLENHDEPRIASRLSLEKHKVAAALLLFLPGMALLHDGQLEGRKEFARIQTNRRQQEPRDPIVARFYEGLLGAIQKSHVRRGKPSMLLAAGSGSPVNVFGVKWEAPDGECDVSIVNVGGEEAPFHVPAEGNGRALEVVYSTRGDARSIQVRVGTVLIPGETGLILRVAKANQ